MNLMPGEKQLMESDNRELILTSHRLRFEGKRWGRGQVTSIMLDSLTSCEITYATRPALLVIAALIATFFVSKMGVIMADVFFGGMAVAGGFVVAYYSTHRQVISLSSPTASIRLNTGGMSLDVAKRFIDATEQAKSERSPSDARFTRVSGE